jgi:hypothetical protein
MSISMRAVPSTLSIFSGERIEIEIEIEIKIKIKKLII